MKNTYIFILFLACMFFACSEDFKHEPLGGGGSAAPDPVKNVKIEKNTPGGAIITYDIPDNVDVQYVKAVYENSQGKMSEVRGSAYINRLEIQGLGDTRERTVKLYAVNKKENQSAPVELKINPLTPPITTIFKSLKYEPGFGGFVVNFENEERNEISINVLYRDSATQNMMFYESFYTSLEQGVYPVRGLPAKENRFGVYVRDRWENNSDTVYFSLTPWPEQLLDKKMFGNLNLTGDAVWSEWAGQPQYAYDDKLDITNYAHTAYPLAFPHRYTLDLGVNAKISRFKFYQRPGEGILYEHGNPKSYRVYARTDNPSPGNPDDVMEGWTLVMECNSFKPSGLPVGQVSPEDEEYAAGGEEYEFPRDMGPVRYIRFEIVESWSGMECSVIGEFTFWGQVNE